MRSHTDRLITHIQSVSMPQYDRSSVSHHDTSIHTHKHYLCQCKCVSEHDDVVITCDLMICAECVSVNMMMWASHVIA